MRNITPADKVTIYFKTAPFLLGEVFMGIGIATLLNSKMNLGSLTGATIFLSIGGYFVYRKVKILRNGVSVLKSGVKTEAVLSLILDTDIQHNSRTVKEYIFEFEVDEKKYSYEYRSAYKRQLKVGDRMSIFYLPNDPDKSFIPKLYNLYFYK